MACGLLIDRGLRVSGRTGGLAALDLKCKSSAGLQERIDPWRYVYLAGLLVFYGVPLIFATNFTAIGHMSALLLGLACYPIDLNFPANGS